MDLGSIKAWKLPYITNLATCQSPQRPTDSAEEPKD